MGLSPAHLQCCEDVLVSELVGPGVRQDRQLPARASCKPQPGQGGGAEAGLSMLVCCSVWLCSHAQGNVTAEFAFRIQKLVLQFPAFGVR